MNRPPSVDPSSTYSRPRAASVPVKEIERTLHRVVLGRGARAQQSQDVDGAAVVRGRSGFSRNHCRQATAGDPVRDTPATGSRRAAFTEVCSSSRASPSARSRPVISATRASR
jgi:hypothetical protein